MVDAPVSKTGEGNFMPVRFRPSAYSLPNSSRYVPVAQGIARPPPKGQVGGSNPPRGVGERPWKHDKGDALRAMDEVPLASSPPLEALTE